LSFPNREPFLIFGPSFLQPSAFGLQPIRGSTNRIDLPMMRALTRRHSMSTDHRSAIDSITAQLIEKYQPEKIILFGSAARGDMTPGSDVDLLIIKRNTPHYGADRIMEVRRLNDESVIII